MFCRPITLCLLNCITEIIQVSEGCKYFPQGPKVCSPTVQHHIRKVCEKITKDGNVCRLNYGSIRLTLNDKDKSQKLVSTVWSLLTKI